MRTEDRTMVFQRHGDAASWSRRAAAVSSRSANIGVICGGSVLPECDASATGPGQAPPMSVRTHPSNRLAQPAIRATRGRAGYSWWRHIPRVLWASATYSLAFSTARSRSHPSTEAAEDRKNGIYLNTRPAAGLAGFRAYCAPSTPVVYSTLSSTRNPWVSIWRRQK